MHTCKFKAYSMLAMLIPSRCDRPEIEGCPQAPYIVDTWIVILVIITTVHRFARPVSPRRIQKLHFVVCSECRSQGGVPEEIDFVLIARFIS